MAVTKMDWQKNVLIAAMLAVLFMLAIRWNSYQEQQAVVVPTTPVAEASAPAVTKVSDIPAPTATNSAPETNAPVATSTAIIKVATDSLLVNIDPVGGDIVKVSLPRHLVDIKNPDTPFILIDNRADHIYSAQSGLVGTNATDTAKGRPTFSVEKTEYTLEKGQDKLTVDLSLQQDQVKITKRFTFTRGEYLIGVEYLIDNQSANKWNAQLYGQIKRDTHEPVSSGGGIGISPFLGGATTTSEQHYLKMSFDDMAKTPLKEKITGGWIAMVQHYFVSAWIPAATTTNSFYTKHDEKNNLYFLGFTGPRVEIASGSEATLGAQFYVGPKDVKRLENLAPYLDLTVDYGVLWWIAKPLFSLTHWIHSVVGNWGLAIIGLTLCVKLLFLWPSTLSYRSMAVMKKLAPKMQEMKESYGDNPTKLREEMFKMYQKEKANPMLGCLPMIIQTPVFIALYWSLMESVDLRQAPFYGWIVDLSVQDPYFVLPLLMGASMWVQQKLNPPAADPTQQKVFQLMPIIFTGMFLFFPAGLVLYMLVNNLISMTHQFWIYKSMEKAKAK